MDINPVTKYEDVLVHHLGGGFGWWQFFIIMSLSIPGIFKGCEALITSFAMFQPNFRCQGVPLCTPDGVDGAAGRQLNNFFTHKDIQCQALVEKDTGKFVPYCEYNSSRPDGMLYDQVTCSNWTYDDKVFIKTLVSEFDLVCDQNHWITLQETGFFIGMLLGSLLGSYLSDSFGRRPSYLVSALISAALFLIESFLSDVYSYTALRIISVTCSYVTVLATTTLLVELVSHQFRMIPSSVVDFEWMLGNMIMGGAAMYLREWRSLHLALALPSLVAWPLAWILLPESPSWLISQNKIKEAVQVTVKAAKWNKTSVEPEEASDIITKLASNVKGNSQDQDEKCGYFKALSGITTNPTTCKHLLLMMLNWTACCVGYYGLAFNPTLIPGDIFINFIVLAAVDGPATLSALFFMRFLGRKWTLILGQFGAGLSCMASAFLGSSVFGFAGKYFLSTCFTATYVYTAELFPTSSRTTAIGFCSAIARVMGALAGPFSLIMTNHFTQFNNLPMIILGTPSLLASIAIYFLPETKNVGLPENMQQTGEL